MSTRSKKRVRHCSIAVHTKNHVYKNDQNNLKGTLIRPRFVSRVVFNSCNAIGASSNWRADYYRYKNLSYVQVLGKSMSQNTTTR